MHAQRALAEGGGKGKVRTTPYWQVQTTPSHTQGAVGKVCNRSGLKCHLRDTPLVLTHVKESIGSSPSAHYINFGHLLKSPQTKETPTRCQAQLVSAMGHKTFMCYNLHMSVIYILKDN